MAVSQIWAVARNTAAVSGNAVFEFYMLRDVELVPAAADIVCFSETFIQGNDIAKRGTASIRLPCMQVAVSISYGSGG